LQRKEIINLGAACYGLTLDVISEYAFGKSWDCLESPDFSPEWERTVTTVLKIVPIGKQLSWLNSFMRWLHAAARGGLTLNVGTSIATKQSIGKLISLINQSLEDPAPPSEHKSS